MILLETLYTLRIQSKICDAIGRISIKVDHFNQESLFCIWRQGGLLIKYLNTVLVTSLIPCYYTCFTTNKL